MKVPIRTEHLDATESNNCRIEVALQVGAQSVMHQYGPSVNFTRFKAFIRNCRIQTPATGAPEGAPRPVQVAARHRRPDLLAGRHPLPHLNTSGSRNSVRIRPDWH